MVSPMPSASSVPMPAVPLTSPAGGGPASVTPEVERVVEGLGGEPVGRDHERHRGGLDRDLHVVEAHLLEEAQLVLCRLDERLGCRTAVLLVEVRVQRAGVDADADRYAAVARLGRRDLLDLRLLAQVARVEPQAVHAGLERGQGHLVVEVDVGHDGDGRAGDDVGQPLGRGLLVAGAAHDVGPGGGQGVDLRQGAVDVGGLRRRHGLHGDRRAVADGDAAERDPAASAGAARAGTARAPRRAPF